MFKIVMAALACALCGAAASAQDYPSKPIKLIVSFGPGGGADIVGRILGQAMAEKLGQPVVIENRPGAAGTIGNEGVARAEKDGYTLGIMTAGQIIAAVMNKSLRYDTATAFEPIGQVATASLIIVARPDFPANNAKELVALARQSPGKLTVASPGFGATQHMSASCSARPPASRCCTCRSAPRRKRSPRCSASRSTYYSTRCSPYSGRCNPVSSRRSR
jgi:tripartite-type tricarboxylate transporter receptor subunit TctC